VVLGFESTLGRGPPAAADRLGVAPLRAHQSVYLDGALFDEQPGTAPKVLSWPHEPDLLAAEGAIRRAKADGAEIVVVALHWGVPPMWLAPYQGDLAEYQRPMAERLVAAGADAIVGHHAHVPLGFEWIEGVPVCYSLGNFMFGPYTVEHPMEGPLTPGLMGATLPEAFHEGIVVRLGFGPVGTGLSRIDLETYVLDERGEPHAASVERHEAIRRRLHRDEHDAGPVPVAWRPAGSEA
jgi:hypothetical protein